MTELTDILSKPPVSLRHCSFDQWLSSLTADEQAAVKKSLLDPAWPLSALTRAFKEAGMPCARDAVSLHRKGMCKFCGPV